MKIVLDLTPDDANKLEEAVRCYRDDGPDEEWQSDALLRVRAAVENAVQQAKEELAKETPHEHD